MRPRSAASTSMPALLTSAPAAPHGAAPAAPNSARLLKKSQSTLKFQPLTFGDEKRELKEDELDVSEDDSDDGLDEDLVESAQVRADVKLFFFVLCCC